MDTDQINGTVIVVGLLCVIGIGIASSTLLSAQVYGAGDSQATPELRTPLNQLDPNLEDNVSDEGGNGTEGAGPEFNQMTTCIPFFDSTMGLLSVIGGFLAIVALIYVRYNIAVSLLLGWTIGPPIGLGYFLVTDCGVGGGDLPVGPGDVDVSNPGNSPVEAVEIPEWSVVVLVGGALLGAAVLLYQSTRGDEVSEIAEDFQEDDPDLESFAAAAGRAAQRIEERNAEVTNAVFRAWVEMTDLLNVDNPEMYTPGEFADAAVEVGMAEDDVRELTELFNEVRYGGKDATMREDQALEVLRNIESQYSADVDVDENVADGDVDDTNEDTDT